MAIEQAVNQINLNDTIEELRNISIQLKAIGEDDPAEYIDDIIAELHHIQDSLPIITSQFVSITVF